MSTTHDPFTTRPDVSRKDSLEFQLEVRACSEEGVPAVLEFLLVALLPAVAMSTVAVNTTSAEKVAIVGSLALVSVALAVWLSRRRGKGVIS